ncbi:MAG: hypothetical protein QXQ38_04525 [Archaeoglobaceae archaeon]|nr:hypothetical protein [Archaeoglobales archaeon]MDI9642269.1 hypothetical protein [Archaeoglobales archaeon]
MDREKISISMLAVFSAVMLTHRFLSLFEITDYVMLFYAGLLTASLCILMLRRSS